MDHPYSKPLFIGTCVALGLSIAGYAVLWCLSRTGEQAPSPETVRTTADPDEVFLRGSSLLWTPDHPSQYDDLANALVIETGSGSTYVRKQFPAAGRSWRATVVVEGEGGEVDYLPSPEEFAQRGWMYERMQNGTRLSVLSADGHAGSLFGYLRFPNDTTLRFVAYAVEHSPEAGDDEVPATYPFAVTYRVFLSDPIDMRTLPLDPYAQWQRASFEGVDLRVPPEVEIAIANGTAALSHRIAWQHTDPCDFKGDAPPLPALVDLDLALSFESGSEAEIVARVFPYGAPDMYDAPAGAWKYGEGFIERTRFGSRDATKVIQGVEGCGLTTYFIPLEDGRTLIAKHKVVTELGGHVYLDIPADVMAQAIVPAKEAAYVEMILSSVSLVQDRGI